MKLRLIAAGSALAMMVVATPARAETQPGQLPIRFPACGKLVTKSFRLGADMNCTGDALLIGKSGITIDLNRKTITGDMEDVGISPGSEPTPTDTVVRNGAVRGFQYGLLLGPNSTIADVTIVDHEYGVRSAAGLTLRNSSLVANTTAYLGTGEPGVTLTGNRFSANDRAVVIDLGSHIPPQSTATQIRNNTIVGNFEHGIYVVNGTEHVIANNIVSANGNSGAGDGFPGIELEPQATYVKTVDNEIDGNGDDGYRDDGANNTASGNKARANGYWDSDGVGTGIEHGTNAGGTGNVALGNDSTTQCTLASMCTAPVSSSTLPLATPACGSTVVASFRLASNVTCPEDWITVTGKDVIVDLNGKTVTGADRDQAVFFADFGAPRFSGVTGGLRTIVKNGAVRGFSGAAVLLPKGGIARNLVVADSLSGIQVEGAKGAQVNGNVSAGNLKALSAHGAVDARANSLLSSASQGSDLWIDVPMANGSMHLERNLIAGNLSPGVYVDGESSPTGVVIASNTILGNGHEGEFGPNSGIYLGVFGQDRVTEAVVKNNVVEGSGGDGYQDAGRRNLARSNFVRANGYYLGGANETGTGLDAADAIDPKGSGNTSIGNDAADQCRPDPLCY
jgi:parallel beta-helix repeat protein